MLKRILIAALFATRAFAACASGFIQITDPFLNPNGTPWSGSIIYTLAYKATVAGHASVGARQQFNVTSGISLCLAPGLYAPVVLNQGGFSSPITNSWGVPTSGGPYTIAQIQGNITLQPASGLVQTITLSQAQVLALGTTPQIVIPAQGSGTVILPSNIVVQVNGSATYNASGLNINLGSNTVASMDPFGFGGLYATYLVNDFIGGAIVYGEGSSFANLPVTVSAASSVSGMG